MTDELLNHLGDFFVARQLADPKEETFLQFITAWEKEQETPEYDKFPL